MKAMNKATRLGPIALLTSILLLAACGTTPPTNFYTLSAEIPQGISPASATNRVVVGIGPVEVADYLDRNQIVTRSGQTRLNLTELEHWAGPIESNIANILAINLSHLLPDTHPIARPWPDADAEYHILLKITRFDSDPTGKVQLNASWGIQREHTHDIIVIRDAKITQPSTGENYDDITQTMSLALATLSEEIALELGKMTRASN
jgi:uncharacterized lipoprotein YmbA